MTKKLPIYTSTGSKSTRKSNYRHRPMLSTDVASHEQGFDNRKREDKASLLLLKKESDNLLNSPNLNSFQQGMLRITKLLFEIEPAASELMRTIDKKAQDLGTYYLAAYSESKDVEFSLRIFRTVRFFVRYIVLMDRYFEVGNLEYKKEAASLLRTAKTECEGYLKYTTQFSFSQFWPFWKFEQEMKNRMLGGKSFDRREVRNHIMFKSSDAPTIYARVMDSELTTFNPTVSLVLHYNQALQDIQDDFEDLEEDLSEKMPNIFLLAATEKIPFEKLAQAPNEIRNAVIETGAVTKILDIVSEYQVAIQNINLPPAFAFLKTLSEVYIHTINGAMAGKSMRVTEENGHENDGKKNGNHSQISAVYSE